MKFPDLYSWLKNEYLSKLIKSTWHSSFHNRRLLTEASQSFTKGTVGHKSRDLKSRQAKCSSEVVNYADKANIRLKKKYYRMIQRGKKANVAKVAVARELACFVWGMMTDNIEVNIAK